jgi:hypothetical protein
VKNDTFARFPEMPWLWSAPADSPKRTYTKLRCYGSFFCDENDGLTRLLAATLAKYHGQRDIIESIFNPARVHGARFRNLPGNPCDYHVHVKSLDTGATGSNPATSLAVPRLLEMTLVNWALVDDNYRPPEKGKDIYCLRSDLARKPPQTNRSSSSFATIVLIYHPNRPPPQWRKPPSHTLRAKSTPHPEFRRLQQHQGRNRKLCANARQIKSSTSRSVGG